MNFQSLYNDKAVLTEIGNRLNRKRLELNLTQAQLAEEAGVGKRTVERLESGESTQLSTFVRLLRVLGWIDGLDALLPKSEPSPMELLKLKGKQRQRASSSEPNDRVKEDGTTAWTWGDEDDRA
ncbi:MAG: helix-turn-helix transcriptional regulator [Verrucomicrobiae bacterium]|nr:helix-turn-helix transcriptional regulator [Verrucomicrobiae bacterium]